MKERKKESEEGGLWIDTKARIYVLIWSKDKT